MEDLGGFVAQYFADLTAAAGSRTQRLELESRVGDRPSDWLSEVPRDAGRAEEAWPVTLALVEAATDDQALFHVAAGPIEDLLHYHAERFGSRFVEEARRNSRFKRALEGVWGWERVPKPLRGQLQPVAEPTHSALTHRPAPPDRP